MLITLALLKGEMGLPGGGLTFEIPGYAGQGDARLKGRGPASFPGVPNPVSQAIIEQHSAETLMGAPITVNHNGKAYPYPQPGKSECINLNLRAYAKFETIIVQDSWWTPATRIADIVLPVACLFERNDITQFWRYVVYQHKIMEPVGEARTDFDIFKDLSKRLGIYDHFAMGMDSEDAWLRRLYAMGAPPMDYDAFKSAGFYKLPVDEAPYVAFADFRRDPKASPLTTPSGKFEIHSETIASYKYADCPGTPQFIEPFEWLGSIPPTTMSNRCTSSAK